MVVGLLLIVPVPTPRRAHRAVELFVYFLSAFANRLNLCLYDAIFNSTVSLDVWYSKKFTFARNGELRLSCSRARTFKRKARAGLMRVCQQRCAICAILQACKRPRFSPETLRGWSRIKRVFQWKFLFRIAGGFSSSMAQFHEDPALLTKEKLKSELIANNVPLPSADSKKDVYVQLYLKNLTVLNKTRASPPADTFSSDDEDSSRVTGKVIIIYTTTHVICLRCFFHLSSVAIHTHMK